MIFSVRGAAGPVPEVEEHEGLPAQEREGAYTIVPHEEASYHDVFLPPRPILSSTSSTKDPSSTNP